MIHDVDLLEKMNYLLSIVYELKESYSLPKNLKELKTKVMTNHFDSMRDLYFEIDEELLDDYPR